MLWFLSITCEGGGVFLERSDRIGGYSDLFKDNVDKRTLLKKRNAFIGKVSEKMVSEA